MILITFRICLCTLVFLWASFPRALEASEKPKKLTFAAVLGLSGYASQHGAAIKNGILLATDKLKRDGWEIDFQLEDDETNSGKTVSAVRSLLARNYGFFIGPTWSFQIKAAEPVLRANNALAITPAGSSTINGGPSDNIFNVCPNRSKQTPVLTGWLKSRQEKRAFVLTAHGDWGELHHDVFVNAVKQSGGTVVLQEHMNYGIDSSSLKSLMLRGRRSKFDILLTTTSSEDMAKIVKARKDLQMDFTIVATDTIQDAVNLELVEPAQLQNVFMSYLPVSTEFSKLHQSSYNTPPSLYSDRAYDAVMVLAEAIAATDGSVGEVRKHLRSGKLTAGITGPIEFNDVGDNAAANYTVKHMKD
jgi:branched-chain amino acid transport system substrate-binding protein